MQVDCDHGPHWSIQNVHILAGIFSLDILFRREKHLADEVNFGALLPETCKSGAFWDMVVNSHLRWLLLFRPDEPSQSDGTNLILYFDLISSPIFKIKQIQQASH